MKPYADDWKIINYAGVEYSESKNLYWYRGRVYDELSANHNGIIGAGERLRTAIKENNNGRGCTVR